MLGGTARRRPRKGDREREEEKETEAEEKGELRLAAGRGGGGEDVEGFCGGYRGHGLHYWWSVARDTE